MRSPQNVCPRQTTSQHCRAGLTWGTVINGVVVVMILVILTALLMPSVSTPRGASRRAQCKNNLAQIGLALHNYHDEYQAFPPAYTTDADGQRLHSWRTLLLPFMDQKALYDTIDLTKPWDDPANARVRETRLPIYECPSNDKHHLCTYLALVSADSCLQPTAPRRMQDIKDGVSNTLMVVDGTATQAVPWMEPRDLDEASYLALATAKNLSHSGGFHGLRGDGSVWMISADTPAANLRALLTIDRGDDVGED